MDSAITTRAYLDVSDPPLTYKTRQQALLNECPALRGERNFSDDQLFLNRYGDLAESTLKASTNTDVARLRVKGGPVR